jgi:hypothetical protein
VRERRSPSGVRFGGGIGPAYRTFETEGFDIEGFDRLAGNEDEERDMTMHCDRWRPDDVDDRRSATWAADTRAADTKASDRERDDVVQALIRHHVDGRLTTTEFEERTDRALASRTRGQLAAVLSDLPSPARPRGPVPVSRRFLGVLLLVIAVAAIVASRGRAAFGLVWILAIVSFVRIRGARRGWSAGSIPSRSR